jgi:hypothetical protein
MRVDWWVDGERSERDGLTMKEGAGMIRRTAEWSVSCEGVGKMEAIDGKRARGEGG